MTQAEIESLADAYGLDMGETWEFSPKTLAEFARDVLAEAEAAQKIKVERGFMGTVARAALEECAAEAPPECAEFICTYIDKYYP